MNLRTNKITILYIALIALMLLGYYALSTRAVSDADYTYSDFAADLEAQNISSVEIRPNAQVPTGQVAVVMKSGTRKSYYDTDVTAIRNMLSEKYPDVRVVVENVQQGSYMMSTILPVLLMGVFMFVLFMFMNRQGGAGGAGMQMMDFGRSRAQMVSDRDNRIKFDDVAGLVEEKQDLEEIVDFLKNPAKYTQVGARIPKGVILVGPPGTGKTLIAKAVAGEAGVPFFSISGSDFVEMFVGVGASRVRDLFQDAKANHPCIVFIDEIDAVARRRGAGLGGGHDEREQTLNQLLVEMDGFGVNEGIIVMAATNRVDILDPAILRPGRFDRKVAVGMPDVKGREEILRVHAQGKPLGDDVDLRQIAQTTAGFSGADLENLLNEAAIGAAKTNRGYIRQEDIKAAFVKVGIGAEKRSKVISDKDKRITAYHEAGHAILFHVLPDVGPVYSVSIIPTGLGAAGYTMPLPEKDELFNTRGKMMQNIIVSLGGRVAEEMVFDDITTGASQDLKTATATAKAMVMRYGFSAKVGHVFYDSSDEVFIGRDFEKTRNYSEHTADVIDSEVRDIIESCYAEAKRIVSEHRDVLDACAELLLKKEKIGREEFEALFEDGKPQEGAAETLSRETFTENETHGSEEDRAKYVTPETVEAELRGAAEEIRGEAAAGAGDRDQDIV
ncbi:MAG: ATP-dependent zinc metalloprotease FtsH [Lachnospiraceae bacterium]|nr:ATP-dependent zinc metalloprotease FtsH [Lachnospiraceae bacterium]